MQEQQHADGRQAQRKQRIEVDTGREDDEQTRHEHECQAFLEIENILKFEIAHVCLPDTHDRNGEQPRLALDRLREAKHHQHEGQRRVVSEVVRQPVFAQNVPEGLARENAEADAHEHDQQERFEELYLVGRRLHDDDVVEYEYRQDCADRVDENPFPAKNRR